MQGTMSPTRFHGRVKKQGILLYNLDNFVNCRMTA